MPITTGWYDDQNQVILVHYEKQYTWEELSINLTKMREMTESVEGNLVSIVDMSQTNSFPKGNILMQAKQIFRQVPQNFSDVIFVTESQMIRTFIGLVFDMMPSWRNKLQFAKTIEEADKLAKDAVAKNLVSI